MAAAAGAGWTLGGAPCPRTRPSLPWFGCRARGPPGGHPRANPRLCRCEHRVDASRGACLAAGAGVCAGIRGTRCCACVRSGLRGHVGASARGGACGCVPLGGGVRLRGVLPPAPRVAGAARRGAGALSAVLTAAGTRRGAAARAAEAPPGGGPRGEGGKGGEGFRPVGLSPSGGGRALAAAGRAGARPPRLPSPLAPPGRSLTHALRLST